MFGEFNLELGGVTLPLQFKTKNLIKLQKLTGKKPIEFLQDLWAPEEGVVSSVCDPDALINLLHAGIFTDSRYKKQTDSAVADKLCGLLETEAEKVGRGVMVVVVEVMGKVLPEVFKTFEDGTQKEETESGEPKNEETKPQPQET